MGLGSSGTRRSVVDGYSPKRNLSPRCYGHPGGATQLISGPYEPDCGPIRSLPTRGPAAARGAGAAAAGLGVPLLAAEISLLQRIHPIFPGKIGNNINRLDNNSATPTNSGILSFNRGIFSPSRGIYWRNSGIRTPPRPGRSSQHIRSDRSATVERKAPLTSTENRVYSHS